MKRVTDTGGQQWIVSRVRNGTAELVHVSTGMLVKVPESTLPAVVENELPFLSVTPFSQRSRSFLTDLRKLRHGAMLAKAAAARRAADRKAERSSNKPAVNKTGRPRKPNPKVQARLNTLLSKLPPEQHAAIIAAMKGT